MEARQRLIFAILISLASLTGFLIIKSFPISATGNFIIGISSGVGLTIGIGIFLTSATPFIRQVREKLKGEVKKLDIEALATELYERLSPYLRKGMYREAEKFLERKIGSTAAAFIHHGDEESYINALPIGRAAAEAVYLCREKIGKVPPIGKRLLTAHYSLRSKNSNIRSKAKTSLESFTLDLRKQYKTGRKVNLYKCFEALYQEI